MQRHSDEVPTSARSYRRLDGIRLLVVDDISDIRDLLSLMLRRAGAEVRTASSAAAALAAVAADPPDAIVTDLGMPEIDGFGLLESIRRLPSERGRDVVAIALTGFAGAACRERCLAAGFVDHVAKPVEIDSLVGVIADAVGRDRPQIPCDGWGSDLGAPNR